MIKVISILFLFLLSFPAYCQSDSSEEQNHDPIETLSDLGSSAVTNNISKGGVDKISHISSDSLEIYFRQDIHDIEPNLKDNQKSLDHLAKIMNSIMSDSISFLGKIEINSWTSPEPGEQYNEKLSWRRSNSIRDYILERWNLPDSMLVAVGRGVSWDKLRKLVAESDMQYRDEVLDIIDNQPKETWGRVNPDDRWLSLLDSREKHLMDLRGGRPYKYLYDNLYPQLRFGSQISFFYNRVASIANKIPDTDLKSALIEQPVPYIEPIILDVEPLYERKPLFAIKTNMLFDAISILNVEIEVPIGNRISVLGEWTFPWWVTKNNGNALELLHGAIEARYWFGDRTDRTKLTGWFAGVYASDGTYDFQWDDDGYQGELSTSVGLTGGFAHSINKKETLRLEYSLGVGFFNTDYRYYEGRQDNQYLVWQHDGKYSWFGPTRAKVSLVWMLYKNRRIR